MKKIKENIIIDSNGCWVWQKSCSSSGYGQFTIKGVYWNTHRYIWQFFNGDIPEGYVIRHTCHNTKCCNPNHLLLGTHKENYSDSKEVHKESNKRKRFSWFIDGIKYSTLREAHKKTSITMNAIIKYTDKNTRIFDIEAYRKATIKAGWKPKI